MYPTGNWLLPLVALGGVVVLAGVARAALSARSTGGTEPSTDDALEALKHRYVAGEIDDATYERRLERLFETETVGDARAFVERSTADREESATVAEDASPVTAAPRTERNTRRGTGDGKPARRSGGCGGGRAGRSGRSDRDKRHC